MPSPDGVRKHVAKLLLLLQKQLQVLLVYDHNPFLLRHTIEVSGPSLHHEESESSQRRSSPPVSVGGQQQQLRVIPLCNPLELTRNSEATQGEERIGDLSRATTVELLGETTYEAMHGLTIQFRHINASSPLKER